MPTRGGTGAAARAAEHSAAARARAQRDEGPDVPTPVAEDEDSPPDRRRRRLVTALVVLLALAAVGVAGYLGYGWTQGQYYVGVAHGQVAVYRGIPQSLGPIDLSQVVETSDTAVEDLPGYVNDRLAQTIRATSLSDARDRVQALETEADGSP